VRPSSRTPATVGGHPIGVHHLATTTVLALALVALLAGPARALDFFELEVYPATTEGQGVHEIESMTTFVGNGRAPGDDDEDRRHRLLRTSLEYNYGLTDKIDVAAYVDLQKPNGDELEYAGSRFRARGGLWDKGRFLLDLGWYLEASVPHDSESDLDLELRPIVSRDIGRFSVDLNPIFELPTVSEERRTLHFEYAARVYYRLSPYLQPGLEFFGDIGEIRNVEGLRAQEHYVLPVLYTRLGHGFALNVGTAFGLTRASDPVIVKFDVEYEFTLP
jgi:hypothetical protein